MDEQDEEYEIGYGKPPLETRFVKGQSGNPSGRPKGSKNLATILEEVGNERVKVNGEGGITYITKKKACVLQLANKAASGDLRAIREFLHFIRICGEVEQVSIDMPALSENESAVLVEEPEGGAKSGPEIEEKPGE